MKIAMTVVRSLALVLSFYGYVRSARKQMAAEIAIAFVLSATGVVMFMAGILNVLKEMTVVLCAGGVILAIRSMIRREKIKDMITVGTLAFVIICAYFAVILPGMKFSHYDNFSHWAIAPKIILANDRFPTYLDKNITFQSYPLGSSAFIYYFVRVIGVTDEWVQMLAQVVLLAGMVITLFAFARKWPGTILAAVISVFLIAGNTKPTDLLVDTLLPLVGVAGLAACVASGDSLENKLWIMLPFTLFLVSIKQSGIFFSIIIPVYAIIRARRSIKTRPWQWLLTVAAPFVLFYLWQRHVSLVYVGGLKTKHSLSLDYITKILKEKTTGDIRMIASKMMARLFNISNGFLPLLIFLIVFAILMHFVLRQKENEGRGLILLVLIGSVIYVIGLFGMYLFSMPLEEALRLSQFDRYYKTILVFAVGVLTIRILLMMNHAVRKTWQGIVSYLLAIGFAVTAWFTIKPDLSCYQRTETDPRRVAFDRLIEKYHIPSGGNYLVVHIKDDGWFYYHLSQYLLDPNIINSVTEDWLDKHSDALRKYDYIIPVEKTEITDRCLQEQFGDQINADGVIELKQYQ